VQIKTEIATLKLLKHPNVVRLYEVSPLATSETSFFHPFRQELGIFPILFSVFFLFLGAESANGSWVVG
jgi:hypothetical protein